jgi:hypothetical protein
VQVWVLEARKWAGCLIGATVVAPLDAASCGHQLLAVTHCIDHRVTVVGVDSKLIHDVVSGCVPTQRHGVACCALDDLVVADSVNSGVVVLSVDG